MVGIYCKRKKNTNIKILILFSIIIIFHYFAYLMEAVYRLYDLQLYYLPIIITIYKRENSSYTRNIVSFYACIYRNYCSDFSTLMNLLYFIFHRCLFYPNFITYYMYYNIIIIDKNSTLYLNPSIPFK